MFFEPFTGSRHVEVTKQRTSIDDGKQMKYLVDEAYPEAKKIKVVQDNLNTHVKASLYKAFPPEEARRIWAHHQKSIKPCLQSNDSNKKQSFLRE